MSTTNFPIKFAANNQVVLTEDPESRFVKFFSTYVGSRIDDPTYGSGVEKLLQTPLTDFEVNSILLLKIRYAMQKYFNDVAILSVTAKTDKATRILNLTINYVFNGAAKQTTVPGGQR